MFLKRLHLVKYSATFTAQDLLHGVIKLKLFLILHTYVLYTLTA